MKRRWKDIPGYEGIYKVSDNGEILNVVINKLRVLKPRKNGYIYVDLYNKGEVSWKRVHRIVAMCFIDNPDNLDIVMHLDNNKSNNHYSNLKWGTISENTKQAFRDGLLDTNKTYELYNDFITIEIKGHEMLSQLTGYSQTTNAVYMRENLSLKDRRYKGFKIRKL